MAQSARDAVLIVMVKQTVLPVGLRHGEFSQRRDASRKAAVMESKSTFR